MKKIPSSENLALVVRYYYIFSDRLLIMSEVSNLEIGFFDPLNDFKNNLTYNRKGLESFYNDLLTGVQYNVVWQYGLWSFQTRGIKSERFLSKNQHTQMKLLNFDDWVNGEAKIQQTKIAVSKM